MEENNQLLWHLPKDFQWFKRHTIGKEIVMGKNTMLNITSYTKNKPLPNRINTILTNTINSLDGFNIERDIKPILNRSIENEIMIIGGSQIYSIFLPYANKLYLTIIDEEFSGDAYFPDYDKNNFVKTLTQMENENNLNFELMILEKIK